MPRYDYRCPQCGAETERQHSIADCGTPQVCDGPVRVVNDLGPRSVEYLICGASLERLIPDTTGAARDKRFTPAAILTDGRRVEGSWGGSMANRGFGKKD